MNNYSDIINLPHHTSTRHKRMSREARAAQFAPFAALNGYGEAIIETARLTNSKIELSEEMKQIINEKLNIINTYIKEKPQVTLTYFIKDLKKKGGSYTTIIANIKHIDLVYNSIILTNKKKINIQDIINIEI
ncbi:MAG: hypothetical protein IKF19_05430 [Bacilli bacterium]|nr:hypothetical protein [Bacilli bacterium]